jgi:peptidoglycan/LPS O-acetylase OafA/YrhL
LSIQTRLDGVDLLRGLAILTVLLNHVNMRLFLADIPYTAGLPHQLVASLFWSGQRGVQIFFAVSGFLITSTSMRRWGALSRLDTRAFYRMRCARIAPLLLALLLVLSSLHAVGLKNFVVSEDTGGLGRALLAALTFHVNWLEATRGYLPGNWDILWSLSVEEMFYLFFPLACRLPQRILIGVLGVFIVLGPFARTIFSAGNDVWHEYSYLGGMDAIALGCLTAILLAGRAPPPAALRWAGLVGTALLAFSVGLSDLAATWGLAASGLDMSVVAIGTCLVIVAAAHSRWTAPRVLAPLTRLGRHSYEVYLTHMFVVLALFGLFRSPVVLLFVATILISAVLGEGVARMYSQPMNSRLRAKKPTLTPYPNGLY